MADKQLDGFPVVPSFVAGEQISAGKLSAWASQTDRGMELLGYSVGDIHGHSWPYFSGVAIGYTPIGVWAFNKSGVALGTAQRHEQIPNLGRAVGPMSALSPRILPGTEQTLRWELPSGRNDFFLPFIPKNGSAITFDDIVVFKILVASPESVIADGQYFVSTTGRVNCFYPTGYSSGSLLVTYTVNVDEANASDSYPDSTLNVIPDPNQTTARCTVAALAANTQLVSFPTISNQQADFHELTTLLGDPNPLVGYGAEDMNYQETPTLPAYFATAYSVGDAIMGGLVYIFDNTSGSKVLGLTVYYENQTSVRIANGSGTTALTVGSDQYSVFVVGTDIIRTLDHVRWRMYAHKHEKGDGSQAVSHDDLSDLFDTWTADLTAPGTSRRPFRKSDWIGHPHPQYLHRRGYEDDTDGGHNDPNGEGANWGGAMLGSLRFGSNHVYDGENNQKVVGAAGDTVALSALSFRLQFITDSNSIGWGKIDWDGSNNRYAMHYTADLEPDAPVSSRYQAFGTRSDGTANWFRFFGTVQIASKSAGLPQGRLEVEDGVQTAGTGEHLKWWSGEGTVNLFAVFPITGKGEICLDNTEVPPDLSSFTIVGFNLLIQSSNLLTHYFPPGIGFGAAVPHHHYDAYLCLCDAAHPRIEIEGGGLDFGALSHAYRLVVWYY